MHEIGSNDAVDSGDNGWYFRFSSKQIVATVAVMLALKYCVWHQVKSGGNIAVAQMNVINEIYCKN